MFCLFFVITVLTFIHRLYGHAFVQTRVLLQLMGSCFNNSCSFRFSSFRFICCSLARFSISWMNESDKKNVTMCRKLNQNYVMKRSTIVGQWFWMQIWRPGCKSLVVLTMPEVIDLRRVKKNHSLFAKVGPNKKRRRILIVFRTNWFISCEQLTSLFWSLNCFKCSFFKFLDEWFDDEDVCSLFLDKECVDSLASLELYCSFSPVSLHFTWSSSAVRCFCLQKESTINNL